MQIEPIDHGRAPAVIRRGPKKSEDPREERAAWGQALRATLGCPEAVPVVWNRRCLGFVRGSYAEPLAAWWRPVACGEDWAESAIRYRMAATTYDGIIAAQVAGKTFPAQWNKVATTNPVAGNWHDLWPVGGNPAAGTYPGAARTAVQWTDASTGALWLRGNVSPDTKNITSATVWASAGATPPTIVMVDRVLTYEACTIAAANQTMTNTLAAQRYIATGEPGLQVSITCQTVLGATASNMTQLRYTDDAGNTLQSAPVSFGNAVIVSAAAPTTTLGARVVCPSITAGTVSLSRVYPLLAGDSGVRLINDYTHSAANTGTLAFVLNKGLAILPCTTAGFMAQIDLVMQVAELERVYDGACVNAWAYFPVATGASLGTQLTATWH